jgi:hypothetical protein
VKSARREVAEERAGKLRYDPLPGLLEHCKLDARVSGCCRCKDTKIKRIDEQEVARPTDAFADALAGPYVIQV